MTDLDQVLEAGTLLIIEQGEYSDRGWSGPVRILKTATKRQLADEFVAQWTPPATDPERENPEPGEFLPWLVKSGYVEDVEKVHSWHVGSYWRFEP